MLATSPSFWPHIESTLAVRRPPPDDSADEKAEPRTDADKDVAARILVVEDDWFAGTDMQATLQEAGYAVPDLVTSANEAVEAAGAGKPDLILMDVRLAGSRDGVDAALEIRRRFGIRCLFVTAYADSALRARAEAAYPIGWLTKPISGGALVAAVKGALE
ncbi:MAG: response regulator [Hyphomicrobiales bacterium]